MVNQNFEKNQMSNYRSEYVKLGGGNFKFYSEGYIFNVENHLRHFPQYLTGFDKALLI